MASVWIARQTGKHGFERLVAIKTVLQKYASDSSFQTMFLDEARIASRIEHNNVVRVLDVGEHHGTTYLVMEYVDGDALATIHRTLKKNGTSAPRGVLLRIVADVCGGLHSAHELRGDAGQLLGVVHRDVSPHNILVSLHGDAKLIDFGIAKARDRIGGDTNTGTVKGKVRYMAPEQALGGRSDRRADIWAMGAVLYDLLSGRPPYVGENDVQTILALTSGLPPPPLPGTVPRPIANVVYRALETSPANRFATAAELQQAIEDAMVATKLGTGTAAVASFLSDHMADRARTRKETILLGLKAAAERENYASLLRSSVQTMTASPSGAATAGLGKPTAPAAPAHPAESTETAGSLGSAAMGLMPRRSPGRRTSVRVVVSAALLGIAVLATLALRPSAPKSRAGVATARTELHPTYPQSPVATGEAAAPDPQAPPEDTPAATEALSAQQQAGHLVRSTPAASSGRAVAVSPATTAKSRPRKPRIDDGF